jgi:uncharacterized membrane protein (DUF106 family)
MIDTIPRKECNENMVKFEEKIDKKFADVYEKLGAKISYKHFYWIIGVLMVIIIGLLGLIYQKTVATDEKMNDVNESISAIAQAFKGLNIEIVN